VRGGSGFLVEQRVKKESQRQAPALIKPQAVFGLQHYMREKFIWQQLGKTRVRQGDGSSVLPLITESDAIYMK